MTPGVGHARGSTAINRSSSRRGRGGLSNGRGRGRAGSRGRGRGRGRKQPVEKSAVELDKELDNYHAEAMHT